MKPCLAVILVGDDPASQVYVANKTKAFAAVGFASSLHRLPASTPQASLEGLIEELNRDPGVHGMLLQLPLPQHLEAKGALARISPAKDVDGFLPENLGKLAAGDPSGALACTPFGVMVLLEAAGIALRGRRVLVIGRSLTVGKPMGLLLLNSDATVTYAHSRSENLQILVRESDVVVAAAGVRELVQAAWLQPHAVVVDVGMHRDESGKLGGDVQRGAEQRCAALSPVPGGVGPMTIAMLLVNTALAAWETSSP